MVFWYYYRATFITIVPHCKAGSNRLQARFKQLVRKCVDGQLLNQVVLHNRVLRRAAHDGVGRECTVF